MPCEASQKIFITQQGWARESIYKFILSKEVLIRNEL